MPGDMPPGASPSPEPNSENLGTLLQSYEPRLRRMLALRIHPWLQRRVDPADVLQETFVEVARRLEEYRTVRTLPFFLWVRFLALQKLAQLHRRHLGSAGRDAGREASQAGLPAASSASLARAFVHPGPTPSEDASRREMQTRVRGALERLEAVDREVLALRYFERLSVEETALVLELAASGVLKRQLRALARLQGELPRLEDMPTPP